MPRRPDPETGLIPVSEPAEAIPEASLDFDAPIAAQSNWTSAPRRPRRRPSYDDLVRDLTRTLAGAQMDMSRQQVALHVTQRDRNGNLMVPDQITWRVVEPGTQADAVPFYLDEQAAENLAESLEPITRYGRRRREYQREVDEVRAECRSLANQLQETRDRCDNYAEQVAFLRRTVRWLEAELRDAHRERRGIPHPPERTPSEFAG
jgi:hypothetical protein